MLKKVHIRLTLLSGGITTLILIIMTLGYLYISEKNLLENRRYSYQSDIYSIAANLENQGVITHQWLSQLESGQGYYISVLDNGTPFLFDTRSDNSSRTQILDSLWQHYRQNEPLLAQSTISYKCYYKSFMTSDYYCFVITVFYDSSPIEMLLAAPLTGIQKQLFRQRLVFTGIIFLALTAIWIFSWIFTGRLLKPIEESRIRQNQFVAAASHELRTPLAVILSCSESAFNKLSLLNQKNDTSVIKLRHDIAAIKSESLRSSKLLNDMLTLSSRDAGHFDINKTSAELDTLLLDTCEVFERFADEKNIRLHVLLPDSTIPPCSCDTERIKQVVAILLHNAISYTPENGSVTAALSYIKKHFELKISDTGVGINDADKPHIFERFYRSEKARSDKNHFGLGLSIAYEIVAAHNGSITVEDNNASDNGTAFIIKLP